MMSDYNIDLEERGVSSVPALMAKIAGYLNRDGASVAIVDKAIEIWLLPHRLILAVL